MGVTNWNFYHLAENVFTAIRCWAGWAERVSPKGEEEGGHCSTVNSGATRTPSMFTPIYCPYPYPSSTIPGVSMQRVWQNSWELFTCSNCTTIPAPLPRTRIQLFLQWPSLTVNMLPPLLPFPVSASFSYPGTPVGCGWHFNLPPEPLVKLAGNERR